MTERPVHDLKSWVGLFEPILLGLKTHDVRVLDRDYQVGDLARLREWEPTERRYTGREALVEITYITSAKHQPCAFSPFALHPASGILSIRLVEAGHPVRSDVPPTDVREFVNPLAHEQTK